MQAHDDHVKATFCRHQELIDDFRQRIEDPNDSTDHQTVLEAIGETVVSYAKELEAAFATTENPSEESARNEHITQALEKLHDRLDFVQEFLEATTSFTRPPLAATAQAYKCHRERDSELATCKRWLKRIIALIVLTVVALPLSIIIQSHSDHLGWMQLVSDPVVASLALTVLLMFFCQERA